MPHTSAICHKDDQEKRNIHIPQDVVRAIQVLPSHSCTMSFAIQAMSNSMSMYMQHIINPRHMCEGYGNCSVCVCVCACVCVCLSVCLSVTELIATYLIYTLKVWCH